MADTIFGMIRFRRGPASQAPALEIAEPYWCLDTGTLLIGNDGGNVPVGGSGGEEPIAIAHITDPSGAHAAAAISFVGTTTWAAANVQQALTDLDASKESAVSARNLIFLRL